MFFPKELWGSRIVLTPSLLVETPDKSACGKITVCRHYYPLKPSLDTEAAQEKVLRRHKREKLSSRLTVATQPEQCLSPQRALEPKGAT